MSETMIWLESLRDELAIFTQATVSKLALPNVEEVIDKMTMIDGTRRWMEEMVQERNDLQVKLVKANAQAAEAKDLFNIAMSVLDDAGVDMDRFMMTVARIHADMQKED